MDRTLLQRQHLKSILDELNSRKSAGETDIFIKYVNNVPIVSKKRWESCNKSENLTFYYQNIRGINIKLGVLRVMHP